MAEIKKIRYIVINENHYRIGDRINILCWEENETIYKAYNCIVYSISDDGFTIWDETLEVKHHIKIEWVVEKMG